MTNITLSTCYDFLEPYCVILAEKITQYVGENPHASKRNREAQYLIETAKAIMGQAHFYRREFIQDLHLEAELAPAVTYLNLLNNHYPGFINGDVTGAEIVRMAGVDTWEKYNNSPIKRVFAEGVARALPPMRVKDKTVWEIGGGVGATTRLMLDALEECEYFLFTDVKHYFIDGIVKVIPHSIPLGLEYFDINHPKDMDTYDIIYATNTIHVAQDISSVIKWLAAHLNPGGRLVLGEGSPYAQNVRWPLDLIFSLFTGWHEIPTSKMRPLPGFLLPEQWKDLFQDAGLVFSETVYKDDTRTFGGVYTGEKIG